MTEIYIDADACPVRDEVYRVAERVGLGVFVVSNGSRPIRPSQNPNIQMIVVAEGADAADDWNRRAHHAGRYLCHQRHPPGRALPEEKCAGAGRQR